MPKKSIKWKKYKKCPCVFHISETRVFSHGVSFIIGFSLEFKTLNGTWKKAKPAQITSTKAYIFVENNFKRMKFCLTGKANTPPF